MANNNTFMQSAKTEKNDEFYTQYQDIDNECSHYNRHFFGKTVYCNCDNPLISNFFRYFVSNFNKLGLKRLICTNYVHKIITSFDLLTGETIGDTNIENKHNTPYICIINSVPEELSGKEDKYTEDDIKKLCNLSENHIEDNTNPGHGDFRSETCISLLKDSDIIITNPPFSLFREFIDTMFKYRKEFLIIGNQNAITYKEVFPLFKENKMWLGYGFNRSIAFFYSPYEDYANDREHKENMIRVPGVVWFTNMDTEKRHGFIELTDTTETRTYYKYDNCDAINVSKTTEIPADYEGVMGVPITFLNKYNPKQFEIVGFRKGDDGKDLRYTDDKGDTIYPYCRILIRRIC